MYAIRSYYGSCPCRVHETGSTFDLTPKTDARMITLPKDQNRKGRPTVYPDIQTFHIHRAES